MMGAIGPLAVGVHLGPGGVFLGILLTPLTTIAGTVYGALAGRSSEQVESAAKMLDSVGRSVDVQYHLRDLVITGLGREQYKGVIALAERDKAKAPVDTVAEVWIGSIALTGQGVNPRLTLQLMGAVRLLSRSSRHSCRGRFRLPGGRGGGGEAGAERAAGFRRGGRWRAWVRCCG
jgi:hypothetical protein